jgi:RNA polymerase sigma-70 factor (ECF subfamily)
LPERERELLSLKYGAGLTNRAIARLTGLSESNVGTLLHRTIAGLRTEWDEPTRAETRSMK